MNSSQNAYNEMEKVIFSRSQKGLEELQVWECRQAEKITTSDMMTALDEKSRGWQTTRTLTECHQYMLDNQLACDVTFSFNTPSGIQTRGAHKYVLMCRSPVFEAMFGGGFKEMDTLTIDDIEPEDFMEILGFMYSDLTSISGHNVLHVMYAAKKYLLDGLVRKCSTFLEEEISEENVCTILNHCLLYNEKALTDKSVEFINLHSKVVYESAEFLDLSQDSMYQLLSAENECLGPMDIFQHCLRWARHQQTKDFHRDQTIRDVMGRCLFQLPLSSMTGNELTCVHEAEPDLLNDKEQVTLFRYIAKPEQKQKAAVKALGFTQRTLSQKHPLSQLLVSDNRFQTMQMISWTVGKTSTDAIDFQVSQQIEFHGITLYGGTTADENHSVHLDLYAESSHLCGHECKMVYSGTDDPVHVTIPTPVSIRPAVYHTVKVRWDNRSITYSGLVGIPLVTTKGCTFTFRTSAGATNYTDQAHGQIPQILFMVKQM